MFNINGWELLIIGVIAVLVIGPKRLPDYVQKLRNFIKEARRMASGARDQLQEESGIDLSGVDWQKLDPRQYDPRRIIREALLDDDTEVKPVSANPAAAALTAQSSGVFAAGELTAGQGSGSQGGELPAAPARPVQRLAPGQAAPWDNEAT